MPFIGILFFFLLTKFFGIISWCTENQFSRLRYPRIMTAAANTNMSTA